MSAPPTLTSSAARVTGPLAGMMLSQSASAMLLATVPVLAPAIARDTGIDASAVGAYTALVFGAAMFSSAMSGTLIQRLGAVRANQAVLIVSALALLLTLASRLPVIAVSAILLGAGYGPNTPTGSQVLSRVTPPRLRAIVFSIKQSGAPIGGTIAGVMLPVVAVGHGWQVAIVLACVLTVAAAAAVEPLRRRLDRLPDEGSGPAPQPSPMAAMREVLRTPDLRRITVAAFVLMCLHVCFQSFTVVFLVDHVGLTLTAAGGLFAVLCAAGAVARITLGWIADRLNRPKAVLVLTSVVGAASAAVFTVFSADWGAPLRVLVAALGGAATSGWYGVFLAEVSRHAAAGRVGLATGGALFFVYSSIVVGPIVFTALVTASSSYPVAFAALSAVTLVATANLMRMRPAGR